MPDPRYASSCAESVSVTLLFQEDFYCFIEGQLNSYQYWFCRKEEAQSSIAWMMFRFLGSAVCHVGQALVWCNLKWIQHSGNSSYNLQTWSCCWHLQNLRILITSLPIPRNSVQRSLERAGRRKKPREKPEGNDVALFGQRRERVRADGWVRTSGGYSGYQI